MNFKAWLARMAMVAFMGAGSAQGASLCMDGAQSSDCQSKPSPKLPMRCDPSLDRSKLCQTLASESQKSAGRLKDGATHASTPTEDEHLAAAAVHEKYVRDRDESEARSDASMRLIGECLIILGCFGIVSASRRWLGELGLPSSLKAARALSVAIAVLLLGALLMLNLIAPLLTVVLSPLFLIWPAVVWWFGTAASRKRLGTTPSGFERTKVAIKMLAALGASVALPCFLVMNVLQFC